VRVEHTPALPFTLPSGGQVAFTLGYAPADEGGDAAGFQVSSAEAGSMTVGVVGSAVEELTRTDHFVQETQGKVDVLFVIDNSGSMSEEQQGLAQNFAAFMSAAQDAGVDYHIGVTTTGLAPEWDAPKPCPGGVFGGEGGRLFPADGSAPRVITPATPNAAAVFAHNVSVGVCHRTEQGLEAAYRALSAPLVTTVDVPGTPEPNDGNAGFLRAQARLALVFVSDEEDLSPEPVSFYATFFQGLKGNDPNKLSISAIVGPEDSLQCPSDWSPGSRYIALAAATGGVVESICTPDWAASLRLLSEGTFPLRRRFPLSEVPADATRIVVRVNGVPVTSGWFWDAGTLSVVFDAGAVPPAGAMVEVTYPLGC
jgi:hypothetical protein